MSEEKKTAMISFVIPIHKKPVEQLKKCVESLLDMSYKDIEIVASFDGPDAELEAYIDGVSLAHGNVVKIVNEHGGACLARNNGFKASAGDIVCFWDADCYAVPEMAKTWMLYFDDSTKPDFLYSGYRWTDPVKPGFESEPFDKWLIHKYNYISTMSPMLRESVIEWDETLAGLQDWDYFRRMVLSGARGKHAPCG